MSWKKSHQKFLKSIFINLITRKKSIRTISKEINDNNKVNLENECFIGKLLQDKARYEFNISKCKAKIAEFNSAFNDSEIIKSIKIKGTLKFNKLTAYILTVMICLFILCFHGN